MFSYFRFRFFDEANQEVKQNRKCALNVLNKSIQIGFVLTLIVLVAVCSVVPFLKREIEA